MLSRHAAGETPTLPEAAHLSRDRNNESRKAFRISGFIFYCNVIIVMLLLGVVYQRVFLVVFPPFSWSATSNVGIEITVGFRYIIQFLYPLVVGAYSNLACGSASFCCKFTPCISFPYLYRYVFLTFISA